MNLDSLFQGSDACVNDVIATIDDMSYLANNLTLWSWNAPEGPVMNFSNIVATNFSSALVDCTTASINAYTYALTQYNLFGNNISNFLLSFLFNLMGNALKFQSIFTSITNDVQNQYYADIANQYGRLINVIFNFQPVSSSGFSLGDFEGLL